MYKALHQKLCKVRRIFKKTVPVFNKNIKYKTECSKSQMSSISKDEVSSIS